MYIISTLLVVTFIAVLGSFFMDQKHFINLWKITFYLFICWTFWCLHVILVRLSTAVSSAWEELLKRKKKSIQSPHFKISVHGWLVLLPCTNQIERIWWRKVYYFTAFREWEKGGAGHDAPFEDMLLVTEFLQLDFPTSRLHLPLDCWFMPVSRLHHEWREGRALMARSLPQ